MNVRVVVATIILSLGAGSVVSGEASPDACAALTRACEAAGFVLGGSESGNGARKDCVEPILHGRSRSPRAAHPLPQVDPALISACLAGDGTPSAKVQTAAAGRATDGVRTAEPAVGANTPNSDGLMVSAPQSLFIGDALGLSKMPDQQTPILRSSDGAYQLFVTGVLPGSRGGVVSRLYTTDLLDGCAYRSDPPGMTAPQRKSAAVQSCNATYGDDCADYVGMEAVFTTPTPNALVGFYIADQHKLATSRACNVHGAFYGQLGVALSSDGGQSWTRRGAILRSNPVPTSCPVQGGPLGFNQPTFIKIGANYYAYFALPKSGVKGIAVARAAVGTDGTPGYWSILSSGQWMRIPYAPPSAHAADNIQVIDAADAVVPVATYVTMPWVSYNNYLKTYLMTMITHDGFYYSKLRKADSQSQNAPAPEDIDRQQWSAPERFVAIPGGQNWQKGAVTWENMSFVTPDLADNHETGKDGYLVFSTVPGWADRKAGLRAFAIASYSFGVSAAPDPPKVTEGGACHAPRPLPPPRCGPRRPNCRR